MTLHINIEDNIKDVERHLNRIERQHIPLATAKALTFTAERAQKKVAETTRQVFKNPTRFTQRAFRKTSATPRRLEATVYLKDISAVRDHYLEVHTRGGGRPKTRTEQRLGGYFVRSRHTKRQRFTRGVMSKILADVGGFNRTSGDAANTMPKAAGGKKRIRYFMRGAPGHRIIYEKLGKHNIVPVLVEVKPPRYRVRLPFNKIVKSQVRLHFRKLFHRQLSAAIKRRTGVALNISA